MSVGIADVFQIPVEVSLDVLITVETRKTKASVRSRNGKMSHSHCTKTYLSV